MTQARADRGGHCRLVPVLDEDSPASDRLPVRDDLVVTTSSGAVSLDAALDELLGAYTESRLEQIAYPDTLSARGWRMALRYAAVVVAGERAVTRIKEIDTAYPMTDCEQAHLAGRPL